MKDNIDHLSQESASVYKYLKLMENRNIGHRETHRIVIEVIPEKAPMGKVVKDHGGIVL